VDRAGDVLDLRFWLDVSHDEIGATRLHLEAQLAELTPEEFEETWSRSEEQS
jgi:hypothetical protein